MERNERGASATEYALVLAGIAAVLVLAIFVFGPVVAGMFTDTCDAVEAEMASTSTC